MKAIVLLSGGLDSTVVTALALNQGRDCIAISFDYGQKHRIELDAAKTIAAYYRLPHKIITIDPTTFGNSALTSNTEVPSNRSLAEIGSGAIPSTYVPARNTLFIAYALGQAEIHQAEQIHLGANALDAAPYPDCRPSYYAAFQKVADCATQQAVEGKAPKLVTPLIHWDKKRIIEEGLSLKAPLQLTSSCYQPVAAMQCGSCDACVLRKAGFLAALQADPTCYHS